MQTVPTSISGKIKYLSYIWLSPTVDSNIREAFHYAGDTHTVIMSGIETLTLK